MNKRLFVAGLPFSSSEDEIKTFFSQAGKVVSVTIVKDKFTNKSRGFGFIEMETEEEAEKAIKTLDKVDMNGRSIVVAEAKPLEKREYSDRPRRSFSNDRNRDFSRRGGSRFDNKRSDNKRGGYR